MEDLVGQVFTYLTVTSYFGKNKHSKNMWNCTCKCGKEKIMESDEGTMRKS